jgi:hypothetical protein
MKKHGITVGIDKINSNFYLSFKATGTLSHEDYEIITPVIDSALEGVQDAKINALFDITEMEGWELRAAWDDFKLGLKHGSEFHKIALYGNQRWQEVVSKVGAWFISGEVKYFEHFDEAVFWLASDEEKNIEPKKDVVQRELESRKDAIRKELEDLFKSNLKITDWNIPEANDQEASEILLNILYEKLSEIRTDVDNGKYQTY